MRPIFFLSILILSTLFFASCTPEEDTTIGIDTSPNTFVGNLDGTEWRSATREAQINGDYLSVYGLSSNGTLLSLRVKLYEYQPINKAYILSNTSDHYVAYDNTSGFDSLVYWSKNNPDINGQSGDITITKIDLVERKVSGTYRSRVFNNHTPLQYYYFSQGAFTDVTLVDSLTIPFAGSNFVNYNGGNTGDGNNIGGNNRGGNNGGGNTQHNISIAR